MARWRLSTSHYLQIPGTEWEQMEKDQLTGREVRKRYTVPRLLDVDDPTSWNYHTRNPRGEIIAGEVVVCYEGKGQPQDIVFIGDPSPDMIPLDDEAREISRKLEPRWNAKPDEETSFTKKLMEQQQSLAVELAAKANTVKVEGLDEMLKAMAAQMTQTQQLIAALAGGRRA